MSFSIVGETKSAALQRKALIVTALRNWVARDKHVGRVICQEMGVNLRGRDISMPEQELNEDLPRPATYGSRKHDEACAVISPPGSE